jgi:K+-transporting ATPase KdpF subunit
MPPYSVAAVKLRCGCGAARIDGTGLYAVLISPLKIQRRFDKRLPMLPASDLGPSKGVNKMIWLAGIFSAGLFAYLFYALIRPERF